MGGENVIAGSPQEPHRAIAGLQGVGHGLSIIGTVINLSGAVCNALGGPLARVGFGIWMFSNLLFMGYFTGAYRKLWIINSDSKYMVLMYGCFLCTAAAGYLRAA